VRPEDADHPAGRDAVEVVDDGVNDYRIADGESGKVAIDEPVLGDYAFVRQADRRMALVCP
jgi:hypothetical protein